MLEAAEQRNLLFKKARDQIRHHFIIALFAALLFIVSIILALFNRVGISYVKVAVNSEIVYGVVVEKERKIDLGGIGIAQYKIFYVSGRGKDYIVVDYPFVTKQDISVQNAEGMDKVLGVMRKIVVKAIEVLGYKRNAVGKAVGDSFMLRVYPFELGLDHAYYPVFLLISSRFMPTILLVILSLSLLLRSVWKMYANYKFIESLSLNMPFFRLIILRTGAVEAKKE